MTTQQPTIRIITASPENRHVISCKEDIAIWRPMAAQGIPIYSQELLLAGALRQEIDWDGDEVRVDI
jgi:mediator of DNA damage checkpoint protein 1